MTGRRVEVIGHGGAGDFFPGNSRASIEQALAIGVDRIEIDLLIDGSDELVLVHNEQVVIAGRQRTVRSCSTADLRSALSGLLTLRDVVELIGGRTPLLIDVKAPGYEHRLIEELRALGPFPDLAFSTTYAGTLLALRTAFPDARRGLSSGHLATAFAHPRFRSFAAAVLRPLTPAPLLLTAHAVGATDIMIQHRVCTPRLVDSAHARGLRIVPWTVNRPNAMRRLVEMGVDGIISNRPDILREVLAVGRSRPGLAP